MSSTGNSNRPMSANSQRALNHLKAIKPRDGWSIECKNGTTFSTSTGAPSQQYRLLRRTIPLTDNSFVDIHYDEGSNTVVGILGPLGTKTCQGQILVNPQGLPVSRGQKIINVADFNRNMNQSAAKAAKPASTASTADRTSRSSPRAGATSATDQQTDGGSISYSAQHPNQHNALTKLALGGILILFGLRMLASMLFGTMFMLYLIGLPALYFYAVQTCPPAMTFNAKKELKRVLRGHHLPDTHPDKPQGMWEEWTARITATLTTELATFPGYEVQQHNLFDAVIGVKVTVPTANLEAYWIGAFSKWHYVYSRELEPRNAAAGVGTGTAGARASTSRR